MKQIFKQYLFKRQLGKLRPIFLRTQRFSKLINSIGGAHASHMPRVLSLCGVLAHTWHQKLDMYSIVCQIVCGLGGGHCTELCVNIVKNCANTHALQRYQIHECLFALKRIASGIISNTSAAFKKLRMPRTSDTTHVFSSANTHNSRPHLASGRYGSDRRSSD